MLHKQICHSFLCVCAVCSWFCGIQVQTLASMSKQYKHRWTAWERMKTRDPLKLVKTRISSSKAIKKKEQQQNTEALPWVSAAKATSACSACEHRRLWEEMWRDAKPDVNWIGVDAVRFERAMVKTFNKPSRRRHLWPWRSFEFVTWSAER